MEYKAKVGPNGESVGRIVHYFVPGYPGNAEQGYPGKEEQVLPAVITKLNPDGTVKLVLFSASAYDGYPSLLLTAVPYAPAEYKADHWTWPPPVPRSAESP